MEDTASTRSPIAIIGMGCKFGGDATNPQKLWKMMAEGRSAWSKIPTSRFNLEGWYHPSHDKASTTNVIGGHFIEDDLGLFDAAFFGQSAETASTMDPQYRLLMESAYEALESAGIPMEKVVGSNTSVFSGAFFHDYQDGHMRDAEDLPRFLMTGNGSAMASNRISHFFDLQGPSMTIDTGCSTTLVALHQACQGLRAGDADMSLVGGSNLLINPDYFVTMSSLGLLSPDGKSYSFDSRANGYGRGEGVATIVLKRLDDALRAGDPIRAVIRETFCNQDGKTETITSPSQEAQERLIRACYQKAGVDPRAIQYFEAHGTGTPTGDPIEVGAVASVFKHGRSAQDPLLIGSVKTNLGHTEPTSGLASVIKVAMALERKTIPPSINFETPNKRLKLDEWNLKVPRACEEWRAGADGVRRASVNNFGYGGANAHVIMEEFSPLPLQNGFRHTNGHHLSNGNGLSNGNRATNGVNGHYDSDLQSRLFILSAKDEHTCLAMASNLARHLKVLDFDGQDEAQFLESLAYTLGERRSRFPWTATYMAASLAELTAALEDPRTKPSRRDVDKPRLGFVFTGQGAQWHAMGRELIGAYPIFKSSLLEAEAILKEFGCTWSVMEELTRDAQTSRVSDTWFGMPLCAAIQISLLRLLKSWGISPAAVTSHSSGEIAAAYAVGALSFRQAMAACYSRSMATSDVKVPQGSMMAVGLGPEGAQEYLDQVKSGQAKVACINSPNSVTISGDTVAVEELETILQEKNIFARQLRVRTAYHSHHMAPLYGTYVREMHELGVGKGSHTMDSVIYSSPTTGGRITDAAVVGSAEHWAKSMISPVLFVDAFLDMALNPTTRESTVDMVIEVGPHAALSGPVGDILVLPEFKDISISYMSCLMRKSHAVETMQTLAANLVRRGSSVDLAAVNFPGGKQHGVHVLHDLPPYPWNHQVRHWSERRVNKCHRDKQFEQHDLLGTLVSGTNMTAPTWRHIIRPSDLPWVRDHTVQSNLVYPGAGYVSMAIEAACQLSHLEGGAILGYRLRDVDIQQALVIPEGSDGVETFVTLKPASEKAIGVKNWREFRISSTSIENKWIEHCRGFIHVVLENSGEDGGRWSWLGPDAQPKALQGYSKNVKPEDLFAGFRSVGIYHGPVFQNLERVQVGDGQSVSTLSVADVSSVMPANYQHKHVIHPTTLDSVFVSAYGALLGTDSSQDGPNKVPKTIKSLWLSNNISSQAGHKFESYVKVQRAEARSFQTRVSLVDAGDAGSNSKTPVLMMDGFVCQSLGATIPREPEPYENDIFSTLKWAPDYTFMDSAQLKEELLFPVDEQESLIIMDLRRACFHYIRDAIQQLTTSDIGQLEWYHKRFYTWMKLQLTLGEQSELGPNSAAWVDDSAEEKKRLFETVASKSVNGEVVTRLGPELLAILRREKAALELLMEDKLLYKYYRDALKFDRINIQLSKIVKHLVHKNPRVKILEIGAGTGGTTRGILDVIGIGARSGFGPLASEYHFTDVSSGFFAEAQERFADWSDIISYRKLDIEADPAKQGFELGSYDIVIACQVLHATKSMETTMANVRSLMKTGGKLLLMESTKNQMDMQLTFGPLPGWWLSEEEDRKLSPILSIPYWNRILKQTGFSGLDLEAHDCESEDLYTFSALVSTALSEDSATNTLKSRQADPTVIVTSNSSSPFSENEWIRTLQSTLSDSPDGVAPGIEPLNSVDPTGKVCIFVGEVFEPILMDPSPEEFENIRALALKSRALVWVTRGGAVDCERPELSLGPGFLRSLRQENTGKRYMTIDLDPLKPALGKGDAQLIARVLADTLNSPAPADQGRDFEFAEREGVVLIPRFQKDYQRNSCLEPDSAEKAEAQPELFHQADRLHKLQVGTPGLLETLAFVDMGVTKEDLGLDVVELEPKAFGLNFRDVMAAMGQLDETVMGLECSGIVTRVGANAASHGFKAGDHIFALLDGQYANRVRISWHNVCHMPSHLDFDTAASVPMVWATAYYSLYDKARLSKGQSVLIHAATGGVGQAAIMLAQLVGAQVFATAGTSEKRDLLITKYGIPADHVFSSRDASFVPSLMTVTNGRGVDVVLNSLSGQLLQESFNCLAPFGHFVEIGKFDLERNSLLEMIPFIRATSFSSIDLLAMVRLGSLELNRALTSVARLIEQRVIDPVDPITIFPLAELEKAFRRMQAGKHIGKIVLSVKPGEVIPVLRRRQAAQLRPDVSYLIVGGVGGIGRSIARWLLKHGARNLILTSRSAAAGGKAASFVTELQEAYPGANVKAVGCDVSNEEDLAAALRSWAGELPPVRGVVQAAMVLEDSILDNMTIGNYKAAVRPKVQGTLNLHKQLGSDLDFFIMLSSLAGVFGLASQTNYTAGGAFQDALARHRTAKGVPGVALDIGAVKEVGYVASNKAVYERLAKAGYRLLSEDEILLAIESAILNPCAQVAIGINTGPSAEGHDAILAREARFDALRYRASSSSKGGSGGSKAGGAPDSLAAKLSSASSLDEATAEIVQALVKKLVDIFMIPVEEVVPSKSMAAFGVDSLVAVELRNMLALQAGAEVSIFDIMQSPSLAAFAMVVASKSAFVSSS